MSTKNGKVTNRLYQAENAGKFTPGTPDAVAKGCACDPPEGDTWTIKAECRYHAGESSGTVGE